MNNAPFSIGQKVVALKDGSWESYTPGVKIIKDQIYTVRTLRQFPCGCWTVDVGFSSSTTNSVCEKHSSKVLGNGVTWLSSGLFAPIQTNYADATSEILEKFKQTDEQPDKILKPEKTTA